MRLLHDMMLLRMEAPPERSAGGIVIPDDARADAGSLRAQREPKIGRVLNVGPGRRTKKRGALVPTMARVGDRVLMDPLAELIEADPRDPLLRYVAEFQCAGVLEG
jgi:co-chaperonin GroES (HSP10)